MTVYRPQPGPQTAFLACPADVAIYGGAAGAGKTAAMMLEAVRYHGVPGFTGAIFRRKTPQIESPGGLWEKARPFLGAFGAHLRGKPTYDARFPSGAYLKFSHLEKESDVENYQGAELTFIGFEELTQFTAYQFTYMLSRNRSTCGVRPYIRATCNPDPDSFVAEMVEWYLDDEGYPHPDKAGVVRYFTIDGQKFIWGATPEEVIEQAPQLFVDDGTRPLSFAFIPGKLEDNPALMREDPGYKAKLNALPEVERARLLGGNWKIRASAGTYFQRAMFSFDDDYPREHVVRYWDLAGSKRRRSDFTAGGLIAEKDGRCWIADFQNERNLPHVVEALIRATAEMDSTRVPIHIEQETGGGAAFAIDFFQRLVLPGYSVEGHQVRGQGTKTERALPLASAAKAGNVTLVRGAWNAHFIKQAEAFPDGSHDDMIDAASGGWHQLTRGSGFYYGSF